MQLKYIFIASFLLLALINAGYAEINSRDKLDSEIENYWQRLKQVANERYNGIDVDVLVSGGLETRKNVWGENYGPYADIKLRVPIYSKQERVAKEEQKQEFLKKGAEYLKILETKAESLEVLQQKAKVYKAFINAEGVKGAENYFNVLEDLITVGNDIKEAKRCLNSMIN
ncbi:MAG: hypothetical protein WC860_06570 [Candidatus Margulisiibacteriota bacterium]